MIKTLVLLLFIGVLNSVTGECPNPNAIPIMYDEDHFTCAKKWFGPGASEWVDACNGCDLGTSFTMRYKYFKIKEFVKKQIVYPHVETALMATEIQDNTIRWVQSWSRPVVRCSCTTMNTISKVFLCIWRNYRKKVENIFFLFRGDSAKYEGPLNIYNNQWGIGSANNCGNGPSSYKCRSNNILTVSGYPH